MGEDMSFDETTVQSQLPERERGIISDALGEFDAFASDTEQIKRKDVEFTVGVGNALGGLRRVKSNINQREVGARDIGVECEPEVIRISSRLRKIEENIEISIK